MTQTRKDAIVALANSYTAAWTSHNGVSVADHFTDDGQITVNNGDLLTGHKAIAEMAEGFYAAFPDLHLMCDDIRVSANHALFVWTFYGHHSETKAFTKVSGWEEWDVSDDVKIKSSRGWFDVEDYAAQISGKPA